MTSILNLVIAKLPGDIFVIEDIEHTMEHRMHVVDGYRFDMPEANIAIYFHQINDPEEETDIAEELDNIWEVIAHPYQRPYCSASPILKGITFYSDSL